MVDTIQSEYNKYTNLPLLSYNCIKYLMDNNEIIWKLLKYNDSKALEKTNLTSLEKASLIYNGQANVNDFRVFSDFGQDDSILSESTILRISVLEVLPSNYVYGHVTMGLEIYAHYKINMLNNYATRIETIVQQLLEVFNGAEVPLLGRLYFDPKTRSSVSLIGAIPFKGKIITLCNHMLG
jgi:hypothetical protein